MAYRVANRAKLKDHQEAVAAALALVPLVEELRARLSALEALIGPTTNATIGRIAPERPRRKRAVHEHVSQVPASQSATPPIIRTIKDIITHDGVTPAEAKRIQDREIFARAEWKPPLKAPNGY